MHEPNYTYSRLSSRLVALQLGMHYDLPEISGCKFYALGLHDNYLIEGEQGKYILRVYRSDWRSQEEIDFELELLTFLHDRNAPAATPVLTITGEYDFIIESPEGDRAAALFNYADGYAPGNDISVAESTLLGKTIASVHVTTAAFEPTCTRKILDIPYLLDESILAIEPFLEQEMQRYMRGQQKEIKEALPVNTLECLDYGICLGDVNPSNFHINKNKKITLFDFDQCGYGYRAFEIGKFISSIHPNKTKHDITKAFIDGYQQVRKLNQNELYTIPYFERISVIWVMAIHVYNAERIGYKWLEKPFWDRRLAVLQSLEDKA